MNEFDQACEDLRRYFENHKHPDPTRIVRHIKETLSYAILNRPSQIFYLEEEHAIAVQMFVTKFNCHLKDSEHGYKYTIIPNWEK